MDRRQFLTMSAAAVAAAGSSTRASEWLLGWQTRPRFDRGFASASEIVPGVYATIADNTKGPQCMSNGGVIAGKNSVLIVEGHFQPAGAALELEIAKAISGAPIRAAIDTHYHLDHTFGNGGYADAKVPILALDRVAELMKERYSSAMEVDRAALLSPYERKLAAATDDRSKERRQQDLGAKTWMVDSIRSARLVYPTETLRPADLPKRLDLGGVVAVLEEHPAHTPADLIVRLPEHDLVFTGDLLFNRIYPVCIDADLVALTKVLEMFASYPRRTRFVPGHGPICGIETVLEQKALVDHLRSHGESMMRAGVGLEEAIDRYDVPKRFQDYSILSWDFTVGAAIRSLYANR